MSLYKTHIFKKRQVGAREEVHIKVFDSNDEPIDLGGSGGLPEGGESGDVLTNIAPGEGGWAPPTTPMANWVNLGVADCPIDSIGSGYKTIDLSGGSFKYNGDVGAFSINEDGNLVVPVPAAYLVTGCIGSIGVDTEEGMVASAIMNREGANATNWLMGAQRPMTADEVNIWGTVLPISGIISIIEDSDTVSGAIKLQIGRGGAWTTTELGLTVSLSLMTIPGDGGWTTPG